MPSDPITSSQLECLRHLYSTGCYLVKIVGGRYAANDCPVERRSRPDWYALVGTVRSMIRRGWLQKVDVAVAEEWNAGWAISDLGREALKRFGG
jgi:hypothetical protein